MNRERVMTIIKDVERFMKDFNELNVKNLQDLKNKEKFYSTSMLLFSMVNRSIDLGEEIVSDKKLGFPEKYRDIFLLLEKAKIIDKKLYNEFSDLIRFRNLVSHEYYTFTEADVFKTVKKIDSVIKFIDIVKKLNKT